MCLNIRDFGYNFRQAIRFDIWWSDKICFNYDLIRFAIRAIRSVWNQFESLTRACIIFLRLSQKAPLWGNFIYLFFPPLTQTAGLPSRWITTVHYYLHKCHFHSLCESQVRLITFKSDISFPEDWHLRPPFLLHVPFLFLISVHYSVSCSKALVSNSPALSCIRPENCAKKPEEFSELLYFLFSLKEGLTGCQLQSSQVVNQG